MKYKSPYPVREVCVSCVSVVLLQNVSCTIFEQKVESGYLHAGTVRGYDISLIVHHET